MSKKRSRKFFEKRLGRFAFFLVCGVIIMGCIFFAALVAAWQVQSMIPRTWDTAVSELLDIDMSGYPVLTEAQEEQLTAQGLNPVDVAGSIEASLWISNTIEASAGDPGVYIILDQHEGRSAAYDAKTAACSNPNVNCAVEVAAQTWLLNHWKENNVTDGHIYDGYTGYTGHASTGELPGGFIASTAKLVCEKGLIPSGDPVLMTCNFWNDRVRWHATAWYVYAIGYRSDHSVEQRIQELRGWNQSESYRVQLIADVDAMVNLSEVYNSRIVSGLTFGDTNLDGDTLRTFASVMNFFGLLPNDLYRSLDTQRSSLPSTGTASGEIISVDIRSGNIPHDGQSGNFMIYTHNVSTVRIAAGQQWSFCASVNETGWSGYVYAAGINAGGLCANATFIDSWAQHTPGLQILNSPAHSGGSSFFTVAINCTGGESHAGASGGMDLIIKNTTNYTIIGQWVTVSDNPNMITFQTVGEENNETTP
ncbi:MAG: hypothetical protein UR67_C0001G0045 [candidate division CPR3 bacterium GW2011_GWF2_35_18]|uniref:Uncharacterized protein n=1 Tax=candidate division CPR3 bacterium GW2011_GWF2_35_18 TaxID=1618350 RepID=A0A0G0C228_UNCC3|nr:MAG: hypothetical protein UR67_C0001G0045 [candidate division CPR3 bacterium GW2011_GWF2_35_18]OGB65577.1 MAG: hypothetical protein A2250_02210 [candidate division CPR3 bacterium RIFOXYA2_FULL_35_13]